MAVEGMRIGLGHDVHRLGPDRPLILGGVTIPFDQGLIGHSDADVLLHALTDALLGAAGLGDIGEWFPNTDDQWHAADSRVFVEEAARAIRERGWEIVNLDCTLFAERPKLLEYKPAIKTNLAKLLGISPHQVNEKPKTGEKVGPVGRGESIGADAIVLLTKSEN